MKPKKIEKLVKARILVFDLCREIEEQNFDSKKKHLENSQEVERTYGLYNSAMDNNRELESANTLLKEENKKYILKVLEINDLNNKIKKVKKELSTVKYLYNKALKTIVRMVMKNTKGVKE